MIKKIVEQGEDVPFSLFLIEKEGKPVIVRKWSLPFGLDYETEEEGAKPMFEILELRDTSDDADLESFVHAVLAGNHSDHPLSQNLRIMRSAERCRQCEEAVDEQRMKGRY